MVVGCLFVVTGLVLFRLCLVVVLGFDPGCFGGLFVA